MHTHIVSKVVYDVTNRRMCFVAITCKFLYIYYAGYTIIVAHAHTAKSKEIRETNK